MSMNTLIIILAIIAYIGFRYITTKMTVKRKIVFAGHPSSHDITNVDVSPLPQNNPQYRIGTETVDTSKLEQMVVKGKSLEPFGIKDGSIVFVRNIKKDNYTTLALLNKLIGRFIVFMIDNERTLQEYPLKNITIAEDGLKLRKVIKVLKKEETEGETNIKQFLSENDYDFANKSEEDQKKELDRYIKKFKFASNYYQEDAFLIMSITYRNGVGKDYSFHSPKYLYGIVEYNTK